MSADTTDFVDPWIEPESRLSEARRLAVECWAESSRRGIPGHETSAAFGVVVQHLTEVIKAKKDAKAGLLVEKDEP